VTSTFAGQTLLCVSRRLLDQMLTTVPAGVEARGHANLAAEAPPPAKPSAAAQTSSPAGAAQQEQEEENPHHADNHPKNRVIHTPLPPPLVELGQGVLLALPLIEDAHSPWSHQESKDDEDDPGENRSLRRAKMPAITSTAAMTKRIVSVLPPLFCASIPRASNMSPSLRPF